MPARNRNVRRLAALERRKNVANRSRFVGTINLSLQKGSHQADLAVRGRPWQEKTRVALHASRHPKPSTTLHLTVHIRVNGKPRLLGEPPDRAGAAGTAKATA